MKKSENMGTKIRYNIVKNNFFVGKIYFLAEKIYFYVEKNYFLDEKIIFKCRFPSVFTIGRCIFLVKIPELLSIGN